MRSSLHRFTRADLKARLEEVRISVTKDVWLAAIKRSRDFKSHYWATDNIHEAVGPVVGSLDTDDEDEDDLLLVSDEECKD